MKIAVLALTLFATPLMAEHARYGEVDLVGLARNSWDLNPLGPSNAMVCNVNGPDGFLSVRDCASTRCKVNRNLKRLAIVEVDTRYRDGRWIWVRTAYRNHTESGRRLAHPRDLHVQGWTHDGYLCDYLD